VSDGNVKLGMSDTPGADGQSAGKVSTMCLDCGCGELNESHGDSRHITIDSIQSAAQASEISVDEAIRNISDGLKQAQASSEQTSSSSAASD
jgi:predicted  nucleic acid-binding Zn-ribbon protein